MLAGLPVPVGAECGCATLRRSDHITDELVCLQWLRVPERIQFQIAVLTYDYEVLHGLAPQYLGPLNHIAYQPGRRSTLTVWWRRLPGCHLPPTGLSRLSARESGTTYWPMISPLSRCLRRLQNLYFYSASDNA